MNDAGASSCAAFLGVDFLDDRRDLGDLVEPDERIDFVVQRGREILRETLRHAAGDDELLFLAALLHAAVLVHLEDVADRFLLGRIDERAGVDDDDVRLFGLGDDGHAGLVQVADHDLAIDEILGATEGNETDFDHAERRRQRCGDPAKSKNGGRRTAATDGER